MNAKSGKWLLSVLLVLTLLLSVVPVLATTPGSTLSEASDPAVSEAQSEESYQVTLITGDVVTVVTGAEGERSFAISPADPDRLGQHFMTIEQRGNTYILPDSADLTKLDMELFNIDYLVDEEYYLEPSLALLVAYPPDLSKSNAQSLEDTISGFGQETDLLQGVNAISTRLAYTNVASSYNILISHPYVEKVWLDRKVHVELAESVPLIGADWWRGYTGYNGSGQKIAILDTGIDIFHPALDDLDDNPATTDPKVIMNIDFSDDGTIDDLNSHGTHCAGIAAGTAAGSAYQGVAPGACLWNVKVIDRYGGGYWSWLINGINFASLGPDALEFTGDEADVISMSLRYGTHSDGTDPLSQAVNLAEERGVVVVVAAGNEGPGPFTIGTPGVAEKAFTVGASDKADILASFSSQGPTVDFRLKPDILAPGVSITSSVPGGSYASMSGTSMATPHVAGAAALLRGFLFEYYGETYPPQLIKDGLMFTAKDLGYNVYEQGSGRLDLDWADAWPYLRVTPASLSLGVFTSEPVASGNLTFFTGDIGPLSVNLTCQLTDIISGIDYSGQVDLDVLDFILPADSEREVQLTVDLTALPSSLYSGKVIATVDDGAYKTIHAIFGFTKVREINIHKEDINGDPAQWHGVWLFSDDIYDYGQTDEFGNVSFYAFDGTYQLISDNWGHEYDQVTIWTIEENINVSGDVTINLDEQDTLLVDFNPNSPDPQIPSAKESQLILEDPSYGYWGWGSSWWYPESFLTRVSPISLFDASFVYHCYPEGDFNPGEPHLINTGEWYNLRYSVTEIPSDITFVADHENLVHRGTQYCLAMDEERASWYQYSFDDISWATSVFGYDMDAPQWRWEWLSPEPVRYYQQYERAMWEPGNCWGFYSYGYRYPPGEYHWEIGCHPLTSSVESYISWGVPPPPTPTSVTNRLNIYGPLFRDPWDNNYENGCAGCAGWITVTQDGDLVLDDDCISDWFWRSLYFEGTPYFTVEIGGWTPFALSRNSYTRLDFAADPGHENRPPRLWFHPRHPYADMYGVVPGGDIRVGVLAEDQSAIDHVALSYSLNDDDIWFDAGPPIWEDGVFNFDLGWLEDCFVNTGISAMDEWGNHIYIETNRAFYVAGAGVDKEAITSFDLRLDDDECAGGNVDITEALDIQFEMIVVTLDGVDVISCGETWIESGVELSFVPTTAEDCGGGGDCIFGLEPDHVWLYPARLNLDLSGLPGIVTEAWIDITDTSSPGSTRAFLYDGGSTVNYADNQVVDEVETLHLVNPEGLPVDRIAVSSCEGQVLEIRLEVVSSEPLPIGAYQAEFYYDGSILQVLDVRLKPPFDTGISDIDNAAGLTRFNGLAPSGALAPVDLAFLPMRIVGCAHEQCEGTLSFTSVIDVDGYPLWISPPDIGYSFQRGDARFDGTVNIADALFIAQYLVGSRPLGDGIDKVHAVNAASVKHDDVCDEINIADVLFICQYLVGQKDECFNMIPIP